MRRRDFLALSAASMIAACTKQSPTRTPIRIGHADNLQSSKHKAFSRVQSLLSEKTPEDFELSIFPSSQLGSERELVEQTQRGTVQITCISNGTLVPFAPRFALLDIPFQFENYAQARSLLSGASGVELLASLNAAGLVGLGFWIQGYRHLTTRRRAVRNVADLKALKIRTMQAPLQVRAFEAMGAVPVPMAWPEVYSALEQGVIAGQENPLSVIYDEQLFRVQDNVTLTGHILDPMPVVANRSWFDGLPTDQRKRLTDAFAAATQYQWGLAERAETDYLTLLRTKTRMNIIELSRAEKDGFRALAQPAVLDRVTQQLGEPAVSAWMAALGKAAGG